MMQIARWVAMVIAAGTLACGAADVPDTNAFYFVQISDTHWGDRDGVLRTVTAVETINKLPMPIEFTVHTGDITMERLTDTNLVASGLVVLRTLKMPVHFVPGNHDILKTNVPATRSAYTNQFGPLIDSREYRGVVFIFAYTEPLADEFKVDGYDPMVEVEQALKKAAGKPVILCQHTPCATDFYNNRVHMPWPPDAATAWERLLNAYNVKAVIAGHFHRVEQHWLGNVPIYVSSAVAGLWGRQNTFRIYEYRNGRLSYQTQYLK